MWSAVTPEVTNSFQELEDLIANEIFPALDSQKENLFCSLPWFKSPVST
jgi:hypothetical protein